MTLWEDLPTDLRAALPAWLGAFLRRCTPGRRIRVPKRGENLDERDRRIRALWHRLIARGHEPGWVLDVIAARTRLSERQVWRITHGGPRSRH